MPSTPSTASRMGALSLNGNDGVPRRLRPAAGGLRGRSGSATSRRSSAQLAARRRGRLRGRARAGQGRQPPAGGLPRRRPAAVPGGGRAVRLRRGPDGHRAHGALPGLRALGSGARPDLRRQGPLRGARPDRRGAGLPAGLREGLRRHGAGRPPRLDVRRQRPRGGGRPGHPAGARAGAAGRARAAHGRAAAGAHDAAGGALRGGARGARPGPDVGDRVRGAARARPRGGCGSGWRRASPACSPSS